MLCQKAPVNSHSPRTYTYEDTEARRVQGIVRGIPPYRDMDAAVFCLSGKACRARIEKGERERGLLKRESENSLSSWQTTYFHRCKKLPHQAGELSNQSRGVPGQSGGLKLQQTRRGQWNTPRFSSLKIQVTFISDLSTFPFDVVSNSQPLELYF